MSSSASWDIDVTISPRLSNPVNEINAALQKLDMNYVENRLFSTSSKNGVHVCQAVKRHWNDFVESENQVIPSRFLEWKDGNIYIIEIPGCVHEELVKKVSWEIMAGTGTFCRDLQPHGSMYVGNLERIEPDESFGPNHNVGATKPRELRWAKYHTLKIEVGVSMGWSSLDRKACK